MVGLPIALRAGVIVFGSGRAARQQREIQVHHVFTRSSDQLLELPVNIPIAVRNGEWVLSVAPDAGWQVLEDLLVDAAG